MDITEKDVKRFSAIALILGLIVLAFIILMPIMISIVGGLILAYIFYPIYKKVYKIFGERNTSALAVGVMVILVIFIPLWFLVPIAMQQIFDIFNFAQKLNVGNFVQTLFPTSSAQLQVTVTTMITSFIGKITTGSLTGLTTFVLDLPTVLLHFTVVIFVFFFAMRDSDKLKAYVSDLSPLKKEKGQLLAKQFKGITNSLIYGHVIIGIIQGLLTGAGLLFFGVPRALLLTLFAVIASILPVVGAWLIWIPVAVYMFTLGNTTNAVIFTLYCLLIVSTIDNILRPYLVSKRTKSSSAIVLIGMIGGLLVFGFLGLIIGPLILEYVVLFLEAYKDRTLKDMFVSD